MGWLNSVVRVVHHKQQEVQFIRKFTTPEKETSIWILGDSYVRRGETRAKQTIGSNLGLTAHVKWFGRGGLCWEGVLPFFHQCLRRRTAPDVLVIHCGGNDIGCAKSVLLIKSIKRDLEELHQNFPLMKIVLSCINERRHWRYGPSPKMDKVRKFVNKLMNTFILSVDGKMVHHPDILFSKPELFLNDNVHLSYLGNDLFLNAIAQNLKDCHVNVQQ